MMDFHQSHQTAIKLAGTVALPSPYPSCGAVSIMVTPDDGEFETYVKIVQIVSARRIVTRFIRLADVRAVRAPAPGGAACGPESWPIIGPKEVRRQTEKKEKDLRAQVTKSGAAAESEWLPAAIIYAPEAAPVLHRNDVGVTAAVSAEDVAFGDMPPTWGSAVGSSCPHGESRGLCPHGETRGLCPHGETRGLCPHGEGTSFCPRK
jgi:hypothetical protein